MACKQCTSGVLQLCSIQLSRGLRHNLPTWLPSFRPQLLCFATHTTSTHVHVEIQGAAVAVNSNAGAKKGGIDAQTIEDCSSNTYKGEDVMRSTQESLVDVNTHNNRDSISNTVECGSSVTNIHKDGAFTGNIPQNIVSNTENSGNHSIDVVQDFKKILNSIEEKERNGNSKQYERKVLKSRTSGKTTVKIPNLKKVVKKKLIPVADKLTEVNKKVERTAEKEKNIDEVLKINQTSEINSTDKNNRTTSVTNFKSKTTSITATQDITNTTTDNAATDGVKNSVTCNAKENEKCVVDPCNDPEKSPEFRVNPVGIQMLSKNLYQQIFNFSKNKEIKDCRVETEESKYFIQSSISHLNEQQLWGRKNTRNHNVILDLPPLEGNSIEEHFKIIGEQQCKPYKDLLYTLTHANLPPMPTKFAYSEGWTRYDENEEFHSVQYPECGAVVFDIEVCVKEGSRPTMAVAVSDKYWYTWCSKHLINENGESGAEESTCISDIKENDDLDDIDKKERCFTRGDEMALDDLIPFGGIDPKSEAVDDKARVIVGHNVSYDRLRIREQYYITDYPLRFIDTMALHIAVSGLIHEQRSLMLKNKNSTNKISLPWMSVGCLNSLNDVYQFYCKAKPLDKEKRNIFVQGSMVDIRQDFQKLMHYCAKDVLATHEVLVNLLPMYYQRFPHPVTMAGMLEMGSSYLPVNSSWNTYIALAEKHYHETRRALTEKLSKRAVEALTLHEDNMYEKDPWLWNLDWAVGARAKKLKQKTVPNWYKKLCNKTERMIEAIPQPANMSTSLRIVPKLLRLTWNGYPLHHEILHGWGYLKPKHSSYSQFLKQEQKKDDSSVTLHDLMNGNPKHKFPVEQLYKIVPKSAIQVPEMSEVVDLDMFIYGNLNQIKTKKKPKPLVDESEEILMDIGIPGVSFVRLPHKNGPGNNVGNPLSKDFLHKVEDGTLSSQISEIAELVLKTTKTIAYWRSARDRIISQNTVWLDDDHLPAHVVRLRNEEVLQTRDSSNTNLHVDPTVHPKVGCILPSVCVSGTVTRRAVERTWLTASNAREDRIGSELKAMVVAPPGYHFVGSDVDSQELWIAALLGDSYFTGIHGGTALSWMTLQGNKAEGTDLHSSTARTAQITRDQAKVVNYGRIYGAGLRFLKTLLMQYNPSLSAEAARQRAFSITRATKGEKAWHLNHEGERLAEDLMEGKYHGQPLTRKQLSSLLRAAERCHQQHYSMADVTLSSSVWLNGSESHTFNCLEALVKQEEPASPVLSACLPRTLQPLYVQDNYMPSRMNWVVQSSAVDYLHVMTTTMQWLCRRYDIGARFSISIHDEVRYLVVSKDRERAALALQITNLLTRSLFAARLGMPDLPLAVAFFSSVDIDRVMRKEPRSECVTPSNPHGLQQGYGIPPGEGLSIYELLERVHTLEKPTEGGDCRERDKAA